MYQSHSVASIAIHGEVMSTEVLAAFVAGHHSPSGEGGGAEKNASGILGREPPGSRLALITNRFRV